MAQITIYLPDDLEKQVRRAAAAHHQPASRWIADRLVQTLEDGWTKGVLAAAGALPDFPDLRTIRKGYGRDSVSRGTVLVTNNTVEFSRVKGLRLSDWTKPRH